MIVVVSQEKDRVLQTYSRRKNTFTCARPQLLYRSTLIFDCFYQSRTLNNLPLICHCLTPIYMDISSIELPLDIIIYVGQTRSRRFTRPVLYLMLSNYNQTMYSPNTCGMSHEIQTYNLLRIHFQAY